jgi:acyl carrier protein
MSSGGPNMNEINPQQKDEVFDALMESIEIVEFAEKVKARYGDRVNMNAWLSGMELDQIIRLSLGDVAAHIRTCLS